MKFGHLAALPRPSRGPPAALPRPSRGPLAASQSRCLKLGASGFAVRDHVSKHVRLRDLSPGATHATVQPVSCTFQHPRWACAAGQSDIEPFW